MRSSCAIVFLLACAGSAGCALDHGRGDPSVHPTPAPDAGLHDASSPVADAAPVTDAAPIADAAPTADAGPAENCGQFWNALPYCPADPMAAIGQYCANEGATCGTVCCEPGPAIACVGNHWQLSGADPDCRGVRCHGPTPCGDGLCTFGRTCVTPAGELGGPAASRCVELPSSLTSCGSAPPGALGSDGCMSCSCADRGVIEIVIDCLCC